MKDEWVASARAELLQRRDRSGVWGYRTSSQPSVEATALACLALARRFDNEPPGTAAAVRRGSDWLVSMQRADGSLGVALDVAAPGWPTAYALLLWTILEHHTNPRRRAAAWLLAEKGQPIPSEEPSAGSIVGHDPSLIGWPWIDGTHSWLEPTALAILALAREGLAAHARVAEGVRLLFDRALPHGGWNYGNRSVFGRELRPQPGPTGLALLALAVVSSTERPGPVDQAINYLRNTLPEINAPISLGWGVLGLRAWDCCPQEAAAWLCRSYALHSSRCDSTSGLGLLLMAHEAGPSLLISRDPIGAIH
jgi:hypothetical protein